MKIFKILFILLLAICGTTNAQYTKLLDFNGTTGSQPYGSLVSDGTFLYGMTNQGGKAGFGVLFKIKPDGTAYDTLLSFLGVSNGAFPRGSLITDGTFLYGMTSQGGTGSRGTIFKIKPDGTGYVKLLDFLGTTNGGNPEDDLMFDGTFLYGMTGQGGTYDKGTIFKINGTGFTNLYNFGDLGAYDASGPNGSLISDGNYLYGLTPGGGTGNAGTIFKIKTDGTNYVKIFDFSATLNGIYPESSLISVGSSLYGVAHYGGASSGVGGVVFKIEPDGSGYVVLHDFTGTADGCSPVCSLISDGTYLYGMAGTGGTAFCSNGFGTIYKIKPDGSGFKKLYDFTGVISGKYPQGALYFDGGYLYGMAQLGGANNNGSIFKFYSFAVDSIIYNPSSCLGISDGSATANASGGLAPYSYVWNTTPAQTTQTAVGLAAGIYTVTVTDANGSSETANVTITQVPENAINAGADSTIICGRSTQLNAEPLWMTLTSGTISQLNSVCFPNNNTGYAVGNSGTILKTTDGGAIWSSLTSGTVKNLKSVFFINETTGFAVGEYDSGCDCGIILKTTNGGANWIRLESGTLYSLNSVYFTSADTGYVAAIWGGILKTTDGGSSWVALTSGTTEWLNSIYFTDANTGYAVGASGTIIKTINAGTNWAGLTSGIIQNLTSVYFADAYSGYAVGSGTIIKTNNGGTNWAAQSNGGISVYFTDANTGYSVGASGTILGTVNGGTNWDAQASGTTSNLNSVHFPSANTGYVVGNAGIILKISVPISYSWSPSSGLSATDIENPIANPTATTTYIVSATTADGCIATDSVTIFIDPLTANAGMDKSIICGVTAQLDSITSNYSGGGTLTYNWSPSAGLNYDTIPNPIATVISNTKFYVTITTPNGCTAIDSVNVLVNPLTAEAGTDKTIICGGTTQLDNVITNYTGTGTLTYNWSPSTGLNYDTIPNPIATVISNTKFYVTVTTPNGCTAIDSVNVSVNPLTAEAGIDKLIICGVTAQLDSITSNYSGSGTLTYLWSPSTGLNYDTIPNPIATVISNTKFYVTVTTPNGCTAIDSVNVLVNPLTANAGIDKTIVCGSTAQLDNVTSNYTGNDTLTYSWSPSAGLNYDTIPNPIATVTNNTMFYVTVTTPNGCNAIDSVSVIVNPLTISGTDANIFCGDSTILNTSTNYTGTGTLTYAWYPSYGLSDTIISNPVAETDSNQTYSVTVTTPNGCVATDDINVSITPMIAPEICIVSVDSINKNLVVWEKQLSSAIDTFYIYRETTTNNYQKIGAVPYDSLSVFVDSTSQPDVQSNKYKISIFDRCGLESEKSVYHKTMHLAINQGVGTTWNLIWESYEGFTVTSYIIYRGTSPDTLNQIGNTSGGSTQYTDLTPPAGYVYYQVEVVSPNSCNPTKSLNSSRSNIASNNPDGIYENNNVYDLFSIFPNPVNDILQIETSFKIIYIRINDISGRLLFTTTSRSIDCSTFAKGIYFIEVKTEKGVAVKKFIRE